MTTYRMDDGSVVDTRKASASWSEATDWDGRNHISRATGSQWEHEKLHRSSKGRYYVERWSQWQGSTPSAEFVSPQDAAAWLMLNEHKVPEDLAGAAKEVSE